MNKFAVVEKQFQYKGHDCICVFNRNGFRCGYVSTKWRCNYNDFDIDCHCGLTFSDALPEEYAPREPFYIGFDCRHLGDGVDIKLAYDYGLIDNVTKEMLEKDCYYMRDWPIRDTEYVVEQCKKIVDQLEELEKQ